MPAVLICSQHPLDGQVDGTLLWRDNVERHAVTNAEEATKLLQAARFQLLVVHRDLPGAAELLHRLRRQPDTRHLSMVVVAPEDFDPGEVELLEAGANAILRLPASPDWDERLTRLMEVPVRRQVRLPMSLEILTFPGSSVETATAMAVNVSVSGMLIESAFELKIGTDLDFDFRLPEDEADIRGCGRVVRMAGRNRYGVEFYGLEGDGTERIRAHIEAQRCLAGGPTSSV